jgi:hypothetical protein
VTQPAPGPAPGAAPASGPATGPDRQRHRHLAVIAGQPLAGAIADGAARLSRADFLTGARPGLASGGSFRGKTN